MPKQAESANPRSAHQLDAIAKEIDSFEAECADSSLSSNFPHLASLPPAGRHVNIEHHPEPKKRTKPTKPKHPIKRQSAPRETPDLVGPADHEDTKPPVDKTADQLSMRRALTSLLAEFSSPLTPEKETLDCVFELLRNLEVPVKLIEAYMIARRQISSVTLSRCIMYYIGYADSNPKTEAEALAYLEGSVTTSAEINRNLLEDFSNKLAMTVADLSAGTAMINKFVAAVNTADCVWAEQSAVISRYKTELEVLLKGIHANPPQSTSQRARTPPVERPRNPPTPVPTRGHGPFTVRQNPSTLEYALFLNPGKPLTKKGTRFIQQMEHWLNQGFIEVSDLTEHDMIDVGDKARASVKAGVTDIQALVQNLLSKSRNPSDKDFYIQWDTLFTRT